MSCGAATALFCFFRAPLTSLADASALAHVRHHGGSYGRLRLWGSLGFLVAAAATGAGIERAGIGVIVPAAAWALAACAAVSFALPAAPPGERARAWSAPGCISSARSTPGCSSLAAAFAQMATAAYDAGFSLHLARLGFGGRFIGAAWATGVAAEIALFGRVGRDPPAHRRAAAVHADAGDGGGALDAPRRSCARRSPSCACSRSTASPSGSSGSRA